MENRQTRDACKSLATVSSVQCVTTTSTWPLQVSSAECCSWGACSKHLPHAAVRVRARFVCHMLQLRTLPRVLCTLCVCTREHGIAFHRAYFGEGSGPVWLDDVICQGNEFRYVFALQCVQVRDDMFKYVHYDTTGALHNMCPWTRLCDSNTHCSLAECSHGGWAMSNCIGHTEDVGVRCYSDAGEMPTTTLPPTTRLPSAATTPLVAAGQ